MAILTYSQAKYQYDQKYQYVRELELEHGDPNTSLNARAHLRKLISAGWREVERAKKVLEYTRKRLEAEKFGQQRQEKIRKTGVFVPPPKKVDPKKIQQKESIEV